MSESGTMENCAAEETISIPMDVAIKECGKTINTAAEWR
jgi:hypothetical protein